MEGGMVAKTAVIDPFLSTTLTIGQFGWTLKSRYNGILIKELDGPTEQLQCASSEMVAIVNGIPQSELKVYDGRGSVLSCGLSLPVEELEYLSVEINKFLNSLGPPL